MERRAHRERSRGDDGRDVRGRESERGKRERGGSVTEGG